MKPSRYKITAILMIGALLSLPLFAQDNYELTDIEFSGNTVFSGGILLDQISMYSLNKFQKNILRKEPFYFTREMFESDLNRLKRFYQQEGFLHVRVEKSKFEVNHKDQTIAIAIDITESQPISVNTVDVRLINNSSEKNDIIKTVIKTSKSKLKLIKGRRFRDQELARDEQQIIRQFVNSGYPYVTVIYKLNVNEANNTVDITWNIDSGPSSVFGDVQVIGNEKVATSLILRQLAFKEGEKFEQVLIDTSQQYIYSLGMFQFVTVTGKLTETKDPIIPVKILVKESHRITSRFGPGYGSEEKFRVFIELKKLGFIGGARRIALNLRHSALEPINISLLFTQPAFITKQSIFTLNPFIRHQKEPGYNVERFGGSSSYGQRLTRFFNASLTYTYEKVNEKNVSHIKDSLDLANLYDKSSITLGLNWDNSKPVFTPIRGWFIGFTLKVNGLFLGSEFHFIKSVIDLRRYQEISDMVLAYRTKVGFSRSLEDYGYIPAEERFYSGGSSSVRGWSRSRLGPLDDEGRPIGGNSLLEASVELRYPIIGSFAAVVFTDLGNVWLPSFTYKLDELRYSMGIGFRYKTPIGPIRLDLARPIFDKETAIQWHFSIGHAF